MRVAVFVHFYVPYRCAGSETMLHAMVKHLQKAGHEVLVIATVLGEAPPIYEYEGVPVAATNTIYGKRMIQKFKPDVLITHHDNTYKAANIADKMNIPFVFMMHNDLPGGPEMLSTNPDMVVFNTEWIRDKFWHQVKKGIVIHPPVWPGQHQTTPGDKITLVNLNQNKGSDLFYELAQRMPDLEFLGVVGGHGEQVIRHDIPNVEIQEHTDEMKEKVWSRTKILLMPSVYESYGMAGVEALASGIPVIAHPTPGLKESQGPFGIFVDRDDTTAYETMIREVLDNYNAYSTLASKRSNELDPTSELDRWVEEIERLVWN